jgi:hypothetical protein
MLFFFIFITNGRELSKAADKTCAKDFKELVEKNLSKE